MSFPLPVGTEGAPALLALGGLLYLLRPCGTWLSPWLSSPTPEPSRESQLGVGGPAAAPTPRPVLGGTKAIVGSMFMWSAPAPSSGAGPCGREGPGAKPRLLLCRTLVWDKHRAPGSSAHAALPTATLWPLREGRCAAAWWVWIPGSPGGWGTGDSPGQGHAGSWSRAHWSRPSQTSDVGPGRAKGRAWGFLSHGGGWGCSCDHFRNLPDELAGALDDMAPGAVGRWWPRARGAAGRVGRWWPRARGAAGRAPVRGGARPAPTRPFPTGLSTLAPPLRLQQCGWPGAWGLGVWGGWGCLCMGVLLVGQAGPQAEPCPHPSRGLLSPGHLLAQGGCRRISGSQTGAARACGHSRWSPLLPRAACPRGPQSPCPGHLGGQQRPTCC